MRSWQLSLFVAAGLFTTAISANAAQVTFTMMVNEDGPGTLNIYATASLGDNGGIASYGVPVTGGVVTIDHNSPNAMVNGASGAGNMGFSMLRSADDDSTLIASQDTLTPSPYLVYGFGQVGGDLADVSGVADVFVAEQQIYDAPLLIATGTWADELPGFDTQSSDLGANVFTQASGHDVIIANVQTMVKTVPEPNTVVLLAMAGLGVLLGIRRFRR